MPRAHTTPRLLSHLLDGPPFFVPPCLLRPKFDCSPNKGLNIPYHPILQRKEKLFPKPPLLALVPFGLRSNRLYIWSEMFPTSSETDQPETSKVAPESGPPPAASFLYSAFTPYPDSRDFQVLKRPRAQLRLPRQCPSRQRLGHAHKRRLPYIQKLHGDVPGSPAHLRGRERFGFRVYTRDSGGGCTTWYAWSQYSHTVEGWDEAGLPIRACSLGSALPGGAGVL